MTYDFPRRRRLFAVALTAVMAVPLLGAAPAVAGPTPPPAAGELQDKAQSEVVRQLDEHATTTFWVRLDSEADTSAARRTRKKTDKDRAVIAAKTAHADRSQKALRALLEEAGAHYTPYWITNTVEVTGDKALAEKIAARPEVASLDADTVIDLPDTEPGTAEPRADGVEWNVSAINAPKVWDEVGTRGEGVVIGSIDTGVDYLHPTLTRNYRGLKADGTYDHSYNWFDATATCPGNAPCDDYGHGTHTMGTMAGDDGEGNAIGVAPGAEWIAAKGCEVSGCSQEALLAAGQWMLAPTDAIGQNPRPDLAPDIINNSWGGDVIDPWYESMVQAWVDAGIFPAFSNGNAGPNCATAGSPGAYTNTYASGAVDSDGKIAAFSSRGSGENGAIKPDISAPGVDVRSAAPGGGYAVESGTSMASPHTAATVALMWSVSPAIRGDVAATERLLDQSATDVDDTTCGGTAGNNNVYGEGRLDAYAAVDATPRGPLGALTGTVTTGGTPLAGATVELDGPMYATATTGEDGTYALPKVMTGDYAVKVSKFGYVTATSTATVTEGATTTRDAVLDVAPRATLTGIARTQGGVEAGATIEATGTPVTATTGGDGSYTLELPAGTYQLKATPTSRCATVGVFATELAAGANSKDLLLPSRSDKFGTTCQATKDSAFPAGTTKLTTGSDYDGGASIAFPFPVALYGKTYRAASANVEGYLSFEQSANLSANRALPFTGLPNGSLYPFWDDLQLATADGGLYWATRGTAPHREVVVEWRNLVTTSARTQKLSFSVVIGEDGTYSFHYQNPAGGTYARGIGATIGAENGDGTDALQYAYNQDAVTDGLGITFRPEHSAALSGTVTDANDGKALSGAAVTVSRGGEQVATGTTGSDGAYLVQVPATDRADYAVTVSAAHYTAATRTVPLAAHSAERAATALNTGQVTATPKSAMTLIVPVGQTRQRTLTLANSGSAADYTVEEAGGARWFAAAPAAGRLAKGAQQQAVLTFDTTGLAPGTVLKGTVVIASDSGRTPETKVPVTLIVPAYQAALDAGAGKAFTDHDGDTWGPDQKYAAGSYGFVGSSAKVSTTNAIEDTADQKLLRTAREGALEYRFDNVPDGVYRIDLDFAELGTTGAGGRVVDVLAEGALQVPDLDIVQETGGSYRALTKTLTVTVTDGQLNLRLVRVAGAPTLVNAVRITQRPDLTPVG
ncbi:S8 family serine peptidase [Streptomyces sp. NBC_01335]|uniref:S8 family serine peptidase n=1 Tax=Streptomyces sp. NBC_01335 TaxID=2903828 RepID=UPI002E15C48E|nr:S8 family serine peptidase [Streptomyces sp. NBC_01335]